MVAAGCRPDAVTYSVLVAAFERGGQWQRALQVRARADAAGGRQPPRAPRARPHPSHATLAPSLQAFERMQQQHRPDACVLNAVMEALWRSGLVSAQVHSGVCVGG